MRLDEILSRLRDRANIGGAAEEEIAALATKIPDPGPRGVRDLIDDWRLIALRLDGRAALHLLGDSEVATPPWITSAVVGIDLEARLARTRNSLYRLGQSGIGEPPERHVRLLAYALIRQGAGPTFGIRLDPPGGS